MLYLVQMLNTIVFQHCPAAGMRNRDEASPSIILACLAILVKVLINLEPDALFGSKFLYLCILILSSH